jgi:uncharacterized protein YciI
MFVISLTYQASLDEIDAALPAHVEWLREGYDRGLFVASGRKVPRTGGMIFAIGERETIERKLENDPFRQAGFATYDVTEFVATMVADGLERFQQ